MPIYQYSNPETGEIKEIIQGMNDVHSYNEDGVEWKRVFLSPNASIDTRTDPFSKKDFVKSTDNKKLTVGCLQNISAEASAARAEKCGGKDPVKEKAFAEYSKKRRGIKHSGDKSISRDKFSVDY